MTLVSTTDPQSEVDRVLAATAEKPSIEKPPVEAKEEPNPEETKPDEEAKPTGEEKKPEEKAETPDDEDEEGEEPDDEEEEEQAKPAGRKKGGFQRKIDRLEQMNRDLMRKLEESIKPKEEAAKPADTAKPTEGKINAGTDAEPDINDYPDWLAYQKDHVKWQVRQLLKEETERATAAERERQERERQAETQRSFQDRMATFRADHEDFDQVVAGLGSVTPAKEVLEYLQHSESGPELLYKLGKNPAEADRIAKLPSIAAIRELAKMEFAIAEAPKPTTEKRTTRAPEPITPVGGRSATTHKDPGTMSMTEYNAWRNNGGGR